MTELDIPSHSSLETMAVWQNLADAHRYLAELKGLCESLPNRAILLDTLSIQEAKDSSEIENIITTHDELYATKAARSRRRQRKCKITSLHCARGFTRW